MRPNSMNAAWQTSVSKVHLERDSARTLAAQLIDAFDVTSEYPVAPLLGTPTSTDLDALESWVEQQFSSNLSELEALLQRQLADAAAALNVH